MIDIRQSIHFANYLKRLGWTVERVGEINYFIRRFSILGSILKVQRPEEIRIDIIRKFARRYCTFQIIVEPRTEFDAKYLTSIGFKLSKGPYLPSKTLQIDLTQTQKDIFRHFKKDARYAIKKVYDPGCNRRGSDLVTKVYSTPDEIIKFPR
jgi:hypothetical protein